MFDLGWTELLLIGIVALIVVGPKDLPILFRQAGQFTGRMRRMAREFTQAMNDAADEVGVSDIEKTMRAAANPKTFGVDAIKTAVGDTVNFKGGDDTAKLAEKRAAEQAAAKARVDDLNASAAAMESDLAPEAPIDPAPTDPKKA